MWTVSYLKEALEDLKKLDGSIVKEIDKLSNKIQEMGCNK
ncbi:MAG: hypothetical protein JG777_2193 [Clostridia bacterium]|jgi:mRNA-degrading endonuclease RelE of RelBE toxin-antitoxin system|nr:hypothetical protein [Clostridia bacterium]